MKKLFALSFIVILGWYFIGDSSKSVNDELIASGEKQDIIKDKVKTVDKTNRNSVKNPKPLRDRVNISSQTSSIDSEKSSQLESEKQKPAHLFKASEDGDLVAVQAFINSGADLNEKDENGQTPIFIALDNEHGDVAKLLLDNGANGLVKNKRGLDLSTLAALSGEKDLFLRLVNMGAPVNGSVLGKMNLLMSSAMEGHTDIGEIILEKNADQINLQDEFGNSALHYAAQGGHFEMVSILMDKKADPSLKNEDGLTALEVAEKEGLNKVSELLKQQQ